MSKDKKYGIWEYISEQHGLTLLESEVHEIIRLARAEMELPDEDEIHAYISKEFEASAKLNQPASFYALGIDVGIHWALAKVRNPYPQTINFKKP
jgi:hypothetical protein